jgi:hypothetical protein
MGSHAVWQPAFVYQCGYTTLQVYHPAGLYIYTTLQVYQVYGVTHITHFELRYEFNISIKQLIKLVNFEKLIGILY